MSSQEPDRVENRQQLRVPVRVEVGSSSGKSVPEYAINLSSGGLCIQSATPRNVGESLQVAFRLTSESDWVQTQAEVVWCTCEAEHTAGVRFYEVGMRFLDLSDQARSLILAFIQGAEPVWPD